MAVEVVKGEENTPPPAVMLDNGELNITMFTPGHVKIISADGKGKKIRFNKMKPGALDHVYAYDQNGKKQVSDLSVCLLV